MANKKKEKAAKAKPQKKAKKDASKTKKSAPPVVVERATVLSSEVVSYTHLDVYKRQLYEIGRAHV